MQMVAADWLNSDKREDDLGGRPGGIVQVFLRRKITVYPVVTILLFSLRYLSFESCRSIQRKVAVSFSSSYTYR